VVVGHRRGRIGAHGHLHDLFDLPQLHAVLFLNNNPSNVQGALWIILSSPEYGVN
jgi:hypothetical protein